jgi:hypothetical protein
MDILQQVSSATSEMKMLNKQPFGDHELSGETKCGKIYKRE